MEVLRGSNIIGHSTRSVITSALLAGVLGFGVSSCGKTTQKDVNDQKYKIELLSINISNYINARKNLVSEYNTILSYPKTEANKYEIDNHLCLLEEQIRDYDKKIEDLVEEKVDAEADLTEKIADIGTTRVHSTMDPNKWDYLLTVQ